MNYKKSEPIYHTAAWKRVCVIVKARQGGMCAECMRSFELGFISKPARAQMVHHIIPYKERPDLAYDPDNLEALCYSCHEHKHNRHGGGDEDKPDIGGMRVVRV